MEPPPRAAKVFAALVVIGFLAMVWLAFNPPAERPTTQQIVDAHKDADVNLP